MLLHVAIQCKWDLLLPVHSLNSPFYKYWVTKYIKFTSIIGVTAVEVWHWILLVYMEHRRERQPLSWGPLAECPVYWHPLGLIIAILCLRDQLMNSLQLLKTHDGTLKWLACILITRHQRCSRTQTEITVLIIKTTWKCSHLHECIKPPLNKLQSVS